MISSVSLIIPYLLKEEVRTQALICLATLIIELLFGRILNTNNVCTIHKMRWTQTFCEASIVWESLNHYFWLMIAVYGSNINQIVLVGAP